MYLHVWMEIIDNVLWTQGVHFPPMFITHKNAMISFDWAVLNIKFIPFHCDPF